MWRGRDPSMTPTPPQHDIGVPVPQVRLSAVRLVIAKCSVDYIGRLTAHLPPATRLLLVKADGSISIHADDRAYKPLNWMSPPCRLETAPGSWPGTNRAGERRVITLEGFRPDPIPDLGPAPGLIRAGREGPCGQRLPEHCQRL